MLGWRGRRGKRGKRVVVGLTMIAGFVIAQGLQAAAVRTCPHHMGAEHGVGAPGHGIADIDAAVAPDTAGHHVHPDAVPPRDERSSHDGPCDCLGPCSGAAVLESPPAPAESVFAPVAPRRQALRPLADVGPTLRTVPFALPYPNAPPA